MPVRFGKSFIFYNTNWSNRYINMKATTAGESILNHIIILNTPQLCIQYYITQFRRLRLFLIIPMSVHLFGRISLEIDYVDYFFAEVEFIQTNKSATDKNVKIFLFFKLLSKIYNYQFQFTLKSTVFVAWIRITFFLKNSNASLLTKYICFYFHLVI